MHNEILPMLSATALESKADLTSIYGFLEWSINDQYIDNIVLVLFLLLES